MLTAGKDIKYLNVGYSEPRREGFLYCNSRDIGGVDIVCEPWEVSLHLKELKEIHTGQYLTYLTSMEAEAALRDWHNALAVGGQLHIIVPNLDFYAQQWLQAEWTEDTLRNAESCARKGFSAFYGQQQGCDPRNPNYGQSYQDVRKSGYNEKRLRFLLQRAGFVDIKTEIKNNTDIVATGKKSMQKGERQIAPDHRNIRADHRQRYQFACDVIKALQAPKVLDLACGVGYGSAMLAKQAGAMVTGLDISQDAIAYAQEYYRHESVNYICADARQAQLQKNGYDAIVSFETIEHIDFANDLLCLFYSLLKPGGHFICSTPNQNVIPFDPKKYRFHIKHYTNSELVLLLENCGFKKIKLFAQHDTAAGEVVPGEDGCFTIAAACK